MSFEPLSAASVNDVFTASTYALIDCCVASCVAELELKSSSSNIALPETPVFKTALVSVLLVKVCVAANPTKLSSCKAVLNSAKEPDIVLLPKSIDLLVSVEPVASNTTVPVALGKVIVLSVVGSTNANVVSAASSVAPSNTRGLAPDKTIPVASIVPVNVPLKVPPVIVGLVIVLFVSVSVPANVANEPSDKALLNCAVVPDIVFEPNAIVLFVKVCEVSLNKVSNCDKVTLPSVPPSDNII